MQIGQKVRALVVFVTAFAVVALIWGTTLRSISAVSIGAGVFAAGLYWLRRRSARHVRNLGYVGKVAPLRPELHLRVAAEPSRVLELLEAATCRLTSSKRKVEFKRHPSGFVALLPSTLRYGYGEQIDVTVLPVSAHVVDVNISSQPRDYSAWLDLGHNLQHVVTLRRTLEAEYGTEAVREVHFGSL